MSRNGERASKRPKRPRVSMTITPGASESLDRAADKYREKLLGAAVEFASRSSSEESAEATLEITSYDITRGRRQLESAENTGRGTTETIVPLAIAAAFTVGVALALNLVTENTNGSVWLAVAGVVIAAVTSVVAFTQVRVASDAQREERNRTKIRSREYDFLRQFEAFRVQMVDAANSVLPTEEGHSMREALTVLQHGAEWTETDTNRYRAALQLRNSVVHEAKERTAAEIERGQREVELLSAKVAEMTGVK